MIPGLSLFALPQLAVLAKAWAAFSALGLAAGGVGLALAVCAFLFGGGLPRVIQRALVGLGITIVLFSAIYQLGHVQGAHEMSALNARVAIEAETRRAEKAEAIARSLAAARSANARALAAANARLKELEDASQAHPSRDRECVPRDLARRLREL